MRRNKNPWIALLLLTVVGLAGCPPSTPNQTPPPPQTPQYNAAVSIDDFASALKGLQDTEINFHSSGLIPDNTHKAIQKDILQAAQLGKQAEAAIATSDFTNTKKDLASAVALLNGLTPQMVDIKNADSQAAMKAAISVAVGVLQTWINSVPAAH
jgi:hypothetical protein